MGACRCLLCVKNDIELTWSINQSINQSSVSVADSYGSGAGDREQSITLEALQALGFLIVGSCDRNK